MSENLSHLVPFDGGSHNFAPYRPPAETRRLTRHAPNTTFVRPGETVPDFMIAAQPDQHQSHQSGNVPAPQFQQTRPPTRDSLQQRRDYGDDFENEQLINPQSGAFHAPSAGQMLPPAPLSQNGLAMVNPAHPAHNDGFAMLPSPIQSFQQDFAEMSAESTDPTSLVAHGELRGFKAIPDPPDLDYWRDRLFNVDEMITLSEDEFNTYFPHVDNVYSHRSTQRYKRKPFVSHYWDCRLKGRPPGTPKSDNPEKKKRKRTARERNLCHVKIKVMEYFPRSEISDLDPSVEAGPSSVPGMYTFALSGDPSIRSDQAFEMLASNPGLPPSHPGANGARYYTIQRVNGNGANGKDDGVSGGHQHTLEESDRVKKSSVQRSVLKDKKDKRTRVDRIMSGPSPKSYHTKATGLAAETVVKHAGEVNLKLYGSCFCPFVQRVWIALELKGIPYQYIEVDPYAKPASLLEVNPRGLVPALRHDNWGCYESNLEDLGVGAALLPGDAKLRAHCRLWADHVNRHLVPGFYRVLQEQDQQGQIEKAQDLRASMEQLLEVAHPKGPFFMGPQMSLVDVQAAPWILRLRRVLKPYRGWPDADQGSRLAAWVDAIESDPHIQATTSTDELYLDSYERYAQNRPNTSQVANAINAGRGLP
ncbi:Glutathione S-transferase/chloride channel [Penicillium brevicompactum]